MFPSKVKLAMMTAAVAAALAAGAVALAQSGSGRPKDETGKPKQVGSPSWTYHILASRNGEPPRKVAVVEMTGDTPIRVDTPGALILFQPRRGGEPDRQIAEERRDQEHRKIVLTSPKLQDIIITQPFVCQIRSHRHIEVRALGNGHVDEVTVKEGQSVKKGDLMFRIAPTVDKAKLDAELAEVELAQLEYNNTRKLSEKNVVSGNEVLLAQAKLDRAKAKAKLASAEVGFNKVVAPFEGIVGRLHEQQGSFVKEGDILTTLSDNSVMWVYFNVPEKHYLEYMANRKQYEKEDRIELVLANGDTFPQTSRIGAIEAAFNNEDGNIKFRADYPNPDGLLRHGQTGTIKIRRPLKNALLIPQRATFEILDERYVLVVDKNDVVQKREIVVQNETDDMFVIKKGVGVGDRIVLQGIHQVRDGEKVEYEFRPLEEVMRGYKDHAE